VNPDRQVPFCHRGKKRLEFGAVERLAVDVRIELDAARAELVDRAL
jgi:hypothetical protein